MPLKVLLLRPISAAALPSSVTKLTVRLFHSSILLSKPHYTATLVWGLLDEGRTCFRAEYFTNMSNSASLIYIFVSIYQLTLFPVSQVHELTVIPVGQKF